ncbi:MAG TPA: rhodanese-like domain-containing protein [Pirellulales bacterium]|nr:rhodanese-like domain-containing protein [Pirellulales bacterium]
MFRSFGLILLAAALAFSARTALAEPAHTKDALDKVKHAVDDKQAVLLDVREQKEWDAGHVRGAVLVPVGDLAKKSKDPAFLTELEKKVPKDKTIYCHCARGGRALVAAEALEKLGYKDVRPLKPGYKDLIEAGFPKAETK